MPGWEYIHAELVGHLTEEQLRDVELEENENRKSLTEAERARTFRASQQLVEDAKKAAAVLSTESVDKPKPRGHKPAYGVPKEAVAESLGIGKTTLVEAEQHVETATQFPFMQGWRRPQGAGSAGSMGVSREGQASEDCRGSAVRETPASGRCPHDSDKPRCHEAAGTREGATS